MTIDPKAKIVLDMIRLADRPPFEALGPAEARNMYREGRRVLSPDPPPVAETRDLAVPSMEGKPVPVRLYRGMLTAADAALPALVYFHGGGWVIGDIDTHDVVCRHLANAARCAIISVDYRLAPEDCFPAAVDDAYAALCWVAEQAASLGIDPARVAVGGDSAGGNLAAVAALLARDHDGPALCFQLLIYPAVDFEMGHESHRLFGTGYGLTHASMVWFRDQYLQKPEDREDWRASPLYAPSLAGLPPAYVLTAEYDPLRDEGEDYAAGLAAAGIAVETRRAPGQIHGFVTMGKIIDAALPELDRAARAMRVAFGLS